jgi:hypothetical protein
MSLSNSDKIKSSVDFLKTDQNYKNEYQLVKANKTILNLKKQQLFNTTHGQVLNYFINPKNGYAEYPFNGSSSFYIDFDVPRGIQHTAYQFVLRFGLRNNGTADGNLMPSPLIVEKVSLLKNSNSLNLDITDWQIYMYNLNKYYAYDKNKFDTFGNFNVGELEVSAGSLCQAFFGHGANNVDNNHYNNIELPICLNRSEFPLFLINDNLTLRVFFKGNISYNGPNNNQIKLYNVGLVLRCHELNNSELTKIVKQPKFNHMHNKVVHLKYSVPIINMNQEFSLPLAGFRNVCGGMFIFILNPENDITMANNANISYHLLTNVIDQTYILDPTGQNINNNIKQDTKWNQYIMSNHFGKANEFLNHLCYTPYTPGGAVYTGIISTGVVANTRYNKNTGQLTYLGFCQDGSDSFNGVYSGGYSFSGTGDHVLRFTPLYTVANPIIHVMCFVPSLVSLENGSINEELA